MNLVDQINERFQQVELPFTAFEHDNSIFIRGNGFNTKTNIQNVKELDYTLQLLSVIKNIDPQLLNDRLWFDENEITIVSFLNEYGNQDLSIITTESVEFLNQVTYNQTFKFINDRITHHIPIDLSYSKSIITNKDNVSKELTDFLSLTNSKLDIQKNEMNKIASEFNHPMTSSVNNSNATESTFSFPIYDGPIEVDNLNEWVATQGLPFNYVEESINDTVKRLTLHHNKGHILSRYTSIDGQYNSDLVSDLNFFNQLYHIDSRYINDSLTTSDDGIVTNLDSHRVAQIDHKGNGIIKIIVETNIDTLETNNTNTTREGASVRIDLSSTIMTNLDNVKDDMELVSQASKDLSRNLNDYGLKIADNLLITELNLDDLKTIDQNIQL